MINDLKLGLKVIKYGLNLKGNIISMIMFLVLGCAMELLASTFILNGMYIGLGAMMIVQLIHSVSVSHMVQTSPYKKKLQTIAPAICGGIYLLFANTISIAFKQIGMRIMDWEYAEVSNAILFSSGLMLIMSIYLGAALKLFWPASIIFFIVFMIYYEATWLLINGWFGEEGIGMLVPMDAAILISYIVIIAASFIMYLIFLATYKLEYSKTTWEAALKRAK